MSNKASTNMHTMSMTTNQVNQPRRILVVEDDEVISRLYSSVLMKSGYHVDIAEDGDAGWKVLLDASKGSAGYDLLITDNSMPKITGLELISMLRSARMNLPVILATGCQPANIDCLQVSTVLIKPFSAKDLLRAVREVLCPAERTMELPELSMASDVYGQSRQDRDFF